MGGEGGQQVGGALDVDAVELGLGGAPHRSRGVDYPGTAAHQLAQRCGSVQVALHQLHALGGKIAGLLGRAGQGPELEALPQQFRAQGLADKAGRAGKGDGAASWQLASRSVGPRYQADATLMRNSSVTAFRFSGSWELIKSMRALARDSLPDEVLGRE